MALTTGPSPRSALSLDQSIDHIRLLSIHSDKSDCISITITTHPLDDAPPYSALSYCCGTEAACREILCNNAPVLVNPNLQAALEMLRLTSYTTLWIDFLCIDQSDKEEKNHQVALMGKIYRAAVRTVVWLGPGGDEARLARSIVSSLAQTFVKYEDAFLSAKTYTSSAELVAIGFSPQPRKRREEFASLSALYLLPWWSRAWVVQEIVLASSSVFFWGYQSFSLNDLIDVRWALISVPGWQEYTDSVQLQRSNQALQIKKLRFSLWAPITDPLAFRTEAEILFCSNSTVCSDPRDKVYSQLGILQLFLDRTGRSLNLRPDYLSSVEQVYIQWTAELLGLGQDLSILCQPRAEDQKQMQSLPSWCPNWSTSGRRPTLDEATLFADWRAAMTTEKDLTISGSLLRLMGHKLDSVAAVGCFVPIEGRTVYTDAGLSWGRRSILRLAQVIRNNEHLRRRDDLYPTGEAEDFAFWRTYCMDLHNHSNESETPSFLHNVAYFEDEILRREHDHAADMTDLTSELDRCCLYCTDVWSPPESAIMARITSGYYCWVPFETNPGDIVFLCAGGRTPFVARRIKGKEPTRYRFLGGCYVDGIMHGEAWKPDLTKDMWFE